jgi:hypothetical protein
MKTKVLKIEHLLDLTGPDGNAFVVMGTVQRLMRDAGSSEAEIKEYLAEATASTYEHLLKVSNVYLAKL